MESIISRKKHEFLDLLDKIYGEEKEKEKAQNYQPKTELGKKLWEIRQKNIADPNVKLLDWDGIEAELAKIRGRGSIKI